MDTHITITVKNAANYALHCAYNTLLSFEKVIDSYMEEDILSIYGLVHYRPIPDSSKKYVEKLLPAYDIPCLILVKPHADTQCEVSIAANIITSGGYTDAHTGKTNQFVGEFLKRFAQVLKETNI